MYGLVYASMADYVKKEGFAGSAGGADSGAAAVIALLMVVLLVVIQLWIVRWLWNTVLVRCVSIARPLPNLWYTLGLLVLIAMIHPGYVAASA